MNLKRKNKMRVRRMNR